MGCTVETVNNGAEAVTAVQKKKYDLVLMDIRCPSWTATLPPEPFAVAKTA